MSKVYKVAYANIDNAGDLLNIYIMKNIFGINIKASNALTAEIIGIGSHLSELQSVDKLSKKIAQKMLSTKHTYVWSTGFLNEEKKNEKPFFKNNIEFCAVRGELTKKRVERMIGKKLNICCGDGGLLTERMFKKPIEKKYLIGIIPHFREYGIPDFEMLYSKYSNSVIIDLRANPLEVYKQIASCEYVLSSSLHGLIIADSFHIPNMHIFATNNMLGDGYKYKDYYSAFGLNDSPYKLRENGIPTINNIIDNYGIKINEVELKKELLISAFRCNY